MRPVVEKLVLFFASRLSFGLRMSFLWAAAARGERENAFFLVVEFSQRVFNMRLEDGRLPRKTFHTSSSSKMGSTNKFIILFVFWLGHGSNSQRRRPGG